MGLTPDTLPFDIAGPWLFARALLLSVKSTAARLCNLAVGHCSCGNRGGFLPIGQPKTDRKGAIHIVHGLYIQFSHPFFQPALIDGANLFQQYHLIPGKAAMLRAQGNMGGETGFIFLAGDCRCNHRRAKFVAHIVLHNQHWTDTTLLRSNHRTEICIVDLSAFYHQNHHAPFWKDICRGEPVCGFPLQSYFARSPAG